MGKNHTVDVLPVDRKAPAPEPTVGTNPNWGAPPLPKTKKPKRGEVDRKPDKPVERSSGDPASET